MIILHIVEKETSIPRRLIFFIAILDLLHSIGFWLTPTYPNTTRNTACQVEAFLLDFTPLASFFVLLSYGIFLFRVIVLRLSLTTEKRYSTSYCRCIIVVSPLLSG